MIQFLLKILYIPIRFLHIPLVSVYTYFEYKISSGKKPGHFYKKLFERLGGTFIKVGQSLSLRYDYFPEEFCRTMSSLQDEVKPFNARRGIRIIERELGAKVSELFQEIKEEPFASASFSQVYNALSKEGKPLAVKVMRPGMPRVVYADTFFMKSTSRILTLFGVGRRMGLGTLIDEIIETLKNELNYKREIKNLIACKVQTRKVLDYVVPVVYPALCSRRVISMDFLEGISLRSLMDLSEEERRAEMRSFSGGNFDLNDISRRLIQVTYKSIFEFGFFHADPHPGNIFILKDGRIGMVDFGIMGHLDREKRIKNLDYLNFLAQGKAEDAARTYASSLIRTPQSDLHGLVSESTLDIEIYLDRSSDLDRPIAERSTIELYTNSMALVNKYKFRLPPNIYLYFKTMFTTDNVLIALNPNYNSKAETTDFLAQHFTMEAMEQWNAAKAAERFRKFSALLDHVAELGENVGTWFEQERFRAGQGLSISRILARMGRFVSGLAFLGAGGMVAMELFMDGGFLAAWEAGYRWLLMGGLVGVGFLARVKD